MKAMYYRTVNVFTTSSEKSHSQGDIIIAFALVSKNQNSERSDFWRIDFIGTLRDYFLIYCARLSDATQLGSLSCDHAYNAVTMLEYLHEVGGDRKPLTPDVMIGYEHSTYAWTEDQASHLKHESCGTFMSVDTFDGTCFLRKVIIADDIETLLSEAMEIQISLTSQNNQRLSNTPLNIF